MSFGLLKSSPFLLEIDFAAPRYGHSFTEQHFSFSKVHCMSSDTVTLDPSAGKAQSYRKSTCEIMRDAEDDPVLIVTSQLNEQLAVCLNHKLKIFGGRTPGSFSFQSRNLKGFVRFESLLSNADFQEPLLFKRLSNISNLDVKLLPNYTGKTKIVKLAPQYASHALAERG